MFGCVKHVKTHSKLPDYNERHYIPDVDLKFANFIDFFRQREILISKTKTVAVYIATVFVNYIKPIKKLHISYLINSCHAYKPCMICVKIF